MNNAKSFRVNRLSAGIVMALTLGGANTATAFNFDAGEWDGGLNTTISFGSSWRMQDPDPALYSAQNAALVGEEPGTGGKSDGGNLNYDKGDRFSTVAKFLTEFSLEKDYMGALVRVKGWYDQALEDEDVRFGNQANGYQQGEPLSDRGYQNLQKFSGVQLMDAFVYNTWDINYKPLQIRLGRQVVNWGESLFIQGVNQGINPIDVPAFRRPGTELREVLLPTNMLYANMGLGSGVSVEAYYQFEWQNSPIEGCGHYWAVTENLISPDLSGCVSAVGVGPGSSPDDLQGGTYYPQAARNDTSDQGQFGVALRFPADAIGTEFGLYAINYHSKMPVLGINTGSGPGTGVATLIPMQLDSQFGTTPGDVSWVYPEDIQLYGISAAANIASWSVGAELTHSRNFPVILNGADLVVGAAQGVGPLGETFATAEANESVDGFRRYNKTQFQINGLNLWSNILGAQTALLIAEVGFQYGDVPDTYTGVRHGRGFTFGFGQHEDFFDGADPCSVGANTSPAGCKNEGYVTDFSWGYRVRGSLDYQNPFGLGLLVQPSLFVGHDVKGNSLDGQFQEGRISTTLATDFTYLKRHKFGASYVHFADSADYNDLRDRDYASVNYSYTF
ncbi:DUF1302 domain-containing protein [Marinobacter sp. M216]|uniref:DUF1302 domain-containing protein n=1 Tax=Marinobacter albus TaxID=3030833 RepID=A0ABT7HEG1_9GAMM|nr:MULTISPECIES: DUF1302 domain-containing protein [unclassified Marinobacter]MBW7472174.1 DUF1302 domain-containing protein [Marinobacter sp. F4218]MDK9558744.1 DUF1302 domain-containing protein [Marinobacter sp. M216]